MKECFYQGIENKKLPIFCLPFFSFWISAKNTVLIIIYKLIEMIVYVINIYVKFYINNHFSTITYSYIFYSFFSAYSTFFYSTWSPFYLFSTSNLTQCLSYHPNLDSAAWFSLLSFNSCTISLNSGIVWTLDIFYLKSTFSESPLYRILNKCPLTHEVDAPGYLSIKSIYYVANLSRQWTSPLNKAGFSSNPSALITPSTPVS